MKIAELIAMMGVWLAFFFAGGHIISWQALLMLISLVTYSTILADKTNNLGAGVRS